MEVITCLVIGICIGIPILFFTAGKQTKDKSKKDINRIGYAKELNDTFATLLELSYNNNVKAYNDLYNTLSEHEKSIFQLYMESKLGKDISKDQVMDSTQMAEREVFRWFVTLTIEASIVAAIAYFLYYYLKNM